jgi:hypothetical protein
MIRSVLKIRILIIFAMIFNQNSEINNLKLKKYVSRRNGKTNESRTF